VIRRCSRCVIPDTRPDTAFVDGVCSACLTFEKRPTVDWKARREELEALILRHRKPGRFDCIVPSSGGKDSTYQVIQLLELGARPLVVTATTCMLTDTGRRNIDNLARFATTIEVTPNREVRAKLNRLGLELVGDVSWPEHVAIFTTPFRVAVDMGIPLLFYGENPQAQYGGPLGSEDARTMTRRWVSEFGGFLGLRPADMVGQEDLTEEDLLDYMPPSEDEIAAAGIEAHFLGQYIPWDSHRNADVATSHGMSARLPSEANWWDFENLDNAMTGLHDHAMYRKYGYGRLAAQISVDIREGRVTREGALIVVEERDGLFPRRYMGVPLGRVLQRLGMSEGELMTTLDGFTNWDLFDGTAAARPILKGVTA
jgi:N-acetyl sugar amidotransferase